MDNNYNYNGFPATYTPNLYYQPTMTTPIYNPRNWQQYNTTALPSYQQQQQQSIQQQQNNNSMVWVQGEAGAKAYALPPNTTLPLWDSETETIYIKSVDASGKPTMTILDYVDRNAPQQSVETSEPTYATKEQVDALSAQFSSINEKLNNLNQFVTTEQLDIVNDRVDNLGSQMDRLLNSAGKSSSNTNNNRRGGK